MVAGTLCSDFVVKGGLEQLMVPKYLHRKRAVMVDMESYGFVQAAVGSVKGDVVIVRGISDLADEHKAELEALVCVVCVCAQTFFRTIQFLLSFFVDLACS